MEAVFTLAGEIRTPLDLRGNIAVWRLAVQQPGDARPGGEHPGLFERPDYPPAPVAKIPQPEDLSKSPLRYASGPPRYFPRLYHHHAEKRVPKLSNVMLLT